MAGILDLTKRSTQFPLKSKLVGKCFDMHRIIVLISWYDTLYRIIYTIYHTKDQSAQSDVLKWHDVILGQHCIRWWLVAWRHQAIAWSIVDLWIKLTRTHSPTTTSHYLNEFENNIFKMAVAFPKHLWVKIFLPGSEFVSPTRISISMNMSRIPRSEFVLDINIYEYIKDSHSRIFAGYQYLWICPEFPDQNLCQIPISMSMSRISRSEFVSDINICEYVKNEVIFHGNWVISYKQGQGWFYVFVLPMRDGVTL